ncbi:hypothetical protein [Vibrio maerlii]|uniref:hypothetical protein n=1 Tax=Vibrio maerlii TaxID=2231648 RepID=UPI000F4FE586|nr:hypothetical protein [Vibrio maerlii]
MKKIHIFASQKNYTAKASDKSKFRVSLAHSLRCLSRMPVDSMEKIQWDDSLSHLNILFENGKQTPLNEISEDKKCDLIDSLVPPAIHDKRRKQTSLANYSKKMRNAITKERASGNTDTSNALSDLLNTDANEHIDVESTLATFTDSFMTRAKQRLNMIETFIHAHNALISDERCGTNTRYQEIIFKIPEKWEVTSEQFTAEDNYKLVKNFVTRLLPDYPILFATSHADENLYDNHCPHIHVFIDGKNAKTGKFDIRAAELTALDNYVNQNGLDAEHWNKKKKQQDHGYSRERGRVWQKIFLNAANAYFKNKDIQLEAERALQTKEYEAQLLEMRRESKRRKSDRHYNYHSMLEERSEQLKQEVSDLEKHLSEQVVQLEMFKQAKEDTKRAYRELKKLEEDKLKINNQINASAQAILEQDKTIKTLEREQHALQTSLSATRAHKEQMEQFLDDGLPKLEQLNSTIERLEEAEKVSSNDQSIKPVLLLNKMLKEYYEPVRKQKKEDERLFTRIVNAFKNLKTKLQRYLVIEKAKDLSREAGCNKLAKELYQIHKNSPERSLERSTNREPN